MKQQSIIDLIGWTLFVIVITLFLMLLYGCGMTKPIRGSAIVEYQIPVYVDNGYTSDWLLTPYQDDWGTWRHIVETDDNMIEWHGYLIVDTGDSLIVIKN